MDRTKINGVLVVESSSTERISSTGGSTNLLKVFSKTKINRTTNIVILPHENIFVVNWEFSVKRGC